MKNAIFIIACCFLSIRCAMAQNSPEVIAHRGHWTCEGSAQNSISSLKNAIRIGVHGSEIDIQLTSDNILIVNHDKDYKGYKIEETPYNTLRKLKLENGESLPSFEKMLKACKNQKGGIETKLIIEIKSHSTPEKNRLSAQETIRLVKKAKMEPYVEYITFNKVAGEELIRLAPDAKIAYLSGDISPKQLKEIGYSGLDYNLKVMRKNEQWFDEAKQAGLTVNVWTVDDEADMRYLIQRKADFITTNNPELLQKILK